MVAWGQIGEVARGVDEAMIHPIRSLYKAVFEALRSVGDVYADHAPIGVNRPYIVFYFVSGGNTREVVNNRQKIILTVKAVTDGLADGLTLSAQFDNLLADGGLFDGGVIVGDADWDICTITQTETVYLVEWDENAKPIYHSGFDYEIVMEAK
jgi:hypothetical protein